MTKPYLSIVATSRNDNHGGNLNLRMQVFVNTLLALSEKHKLPIELILVDWNPPSEAPLLAKALNWPECHAYCSVRVIEVPTEIHNTYKHADSLPLYQMIAKNVGIRRAKGEFVLCTNVDIVFSDELFAFFATRTLKTKTSYRSDRRDVGNTLDATWPLERVLEYCQNNLIRINGREASVNLLTNHRHEVYPKGCTEATLGYPPLHTNGCGDFTLLSREDWFRLRGYVEWDIFSFHLDSLFLFTAHYGGCREVVLAPELTHYHIEHCEGWTPEIHGAGILENHLTKKAINRLTNADLKSLIAEMAKQKKTLMTNDEHWGLAQKFLRENHVTLANWESSSGKEGGNEDESPYLSLVVTTRNDDHGGNMVPRFQTFLDHLNDMCERHRLPVELIVVEWNPDPSHVPLSEAMKWPNSTWVQTRIIVVPHKVHAAHDNHDKFPLFQMIAKNVGIRRAKGEFILATNIDLVFSDELFSFLAKRLLDSACMYRIDRHDIGVTSIPEKFSWQERLEFCENNLIRVQGQHGTHAWGAVKSEGNPDSLHTNACGDFTLLSREVWHTLKGYPEFHLWSIYIDGLLIHAAIAIGIKQVILREPCRIYHIEHDLGWAKTQTPIIDRPSLDYYQQYLPFCKGMQVRKKNLEINSETWGLADMQLEETFLHKGDTSFQTNNSSGKTIELSTFEHWIKVLTAIDNRLYYRDQSAESLQSLVDLVHEHKPTVIVELGTLTGLSLRAWLFATKTAHIHAVDLSFKPLLASCDHFPVDFSRFTMHEQNILTLDFSSLWDSNDRVLLFVDAHDLPSVPIMEHVLNNALAVLPRGSIVVVDDLWYSSEKLTESTAKSYFETERLDQIDELQCFNGHYAPYHKGGSFFGFREAIPFFDFVNAREITLQFEQKGKHVWFEWDGEMHASSVKVSCQHNVMEWGEFDYNPLRIESDHPLTQRILTTAAQLYKQGKINEVIPLLDNLLKTRQSAEVCLALAICVGRIGRLFEAYSIVTAGLRMNGNNLRIERLKRDLARRLIIEDYPRIGNKGVTIYAAPKAFTGHTGIIQKNAIRSWTKLTPRPEIILFGDESGIAEIAQEIGARHVSDVACNEFGTPLVDDIIHSATRMAQNDVLAYINSDIILFGDFISGIENAANSYTEFLLTGRRWDLNVVEEIDFGSSNWQQKLRDDISHNGFLHFATGLDYFVHTKGLWVGMPPFALGRCAWDNWLIKQPLLMKKAVIDFTEYITAVHQEHGYSHGGGRDKVFKGLEAKRNRGMAGNVCGLTSEATLFMTRDGNILPRAPLPVDYTDPQAIAKRVRWLVIQGERMERKGLNEIAIAKYEEANQFAPNNPHLAEKINSLCRTGKKIS